MHLHRLVSFFPIIALIFFFCSTSETRRRFRPFDDDDGDSPRL